MNSFCSELRRAAILIPILLVQACAHRPPGADLAPGRFYQGLPYGSEQQFNPLSQLLNEGFNNLALYTDDLGLANLPWDEASRNLGSSLANPSDSYRRAGWSRVVQNELLPLSGKDGGQWLPNWQDHFLGSGMVSARMTEWFAAHGFAYPAFWSYGTMTASHVLNELVEMPNPRSVDAITDLLIFDNLGFLAFRSERVQRLFSDRVELTSWAWQPVVTFSDFAMENAGQSFVLKVPLRRDASLQGFYLWGIAHVIGLSHDIGDGRALSWGLGAGGEGITQLDATDGFRSVDIGPRAGVFLDQRGSLLAAFLLGNHNGARATLNVYPGLLKVGGQSLGLWAALPLSGGLRFGITTPLGIGAGIGQQSRR